MVAEGVCRRLAMRDFPVKIKNVLCSFGVLHTTNTALNIFYSLALLLSISRVLPRDQYAKIIFLTAVSFYFQPIDQALGRVSFAELRGHVVRHTDSPRYVITILFIQFAALTAASLLIPLVVIDKSNIGYRASDSFYLAYALLTNFWAFDLQSTAFALEMSGRFVRWSLLHRLCQFCVLGALWLSAGISVFAPLAACLQIAFVAFACGVLGQEMRSHSYTAPSVPKSNRVKVLSTTIISGLADLSVLNAPYAVISFTYGVGSTLVIFDSVMKAARLVMAGSRTLAEIGLPRYSRLIVQLNAKSANRLFFFLVALCVCASAVPAAAVAINAPLIFSLLLGPNNIIPASDGVVIGMIILATGVYQPASMLMSFTSNHSAIYRFALLVSSMSVLIFAVIVLNRPDPTQLLWCFAILLMISATGAAAIGGGVSLRRNKR